MSQEAILNIVLSTIVALTAIFALFQTHKQIKLSNKQFLFNRRLDKYNNTKNLRCIHTGDFIILEHYTNALTIISAASSIDIRLLSMQR